MYNKAIGFVTKSIDFYLGGIEHHKKLWPCFTEDDRIKSKNTEKLNLFFSFDF